jgi:hypothetical protein
LSWPWLWPLDIPGYPAGWGGTVARLREFLATGSDRAAIYTWYFGRQYAGPQAPWHFAWVFFGLTAPVATHAFAAVGLVKCLAEGRREFRPRLTAFAVPVALLFFTLPLHRYDGERLFLFVFPLWGALAGVGAAVAAQFLSKAIPAALTQFAVLALLATGIVGILRTHPCELSYYNCVIGGLAGANRCGLEATYWGDSLTNEMLDRFSVAAEKGEKAALLPTLYAGHAVQLSSSGMRAKRQQVVPGDWLYPPGEEPADFESLGGAHWAILFNRKGYLIDPLPQRVLSEGETVWELAREGVWLARVVRLPNGWRLARPTR